MLNCNWYRVSPGLFSTDCGNDYSVDEEPDGNALVSNYCCYCGEKLNVDFHYLTDEDSEEAVVLNAPMTIFLNYGDVDGKQEHADLYSSGEVTWCIDSVYKTDVRYVRADIIEKEVDRLREVCMLNSIDPDQELPF